jgi:hypothetical protein
MSYQDDGMVWHRERSSYADRQRLAHMRAQSEAILAARPELAGPYRVSAPKVKVAAEPVEFVPEPVLTAGRKAEAFLLDALTPDALPALQVQAMAEAEGIAIRTLRRVAKRIGVVKTKEGRGGWSWRLKDDHEDGGQL